MECPNCGASIPQGVERCRKCGSVVESPPFAVPAVAAPQVAAPQSPVNVVIQMGQAGGQAQIPQFVGPPVKSKVVAGILGIFLGAFGVHRFYLGHVGIGLAQLLLTLLTCFYGLLITGPWGLIEGILILVGTIDRDGQGRLLKP